MNANTHLPCPTRYTSEARFGFFDRIWRFGILRLILACCVLAISACTTTPLSTTAWPGGPTLLADGSSAARTQQALLGQYQAWRGVPYALGGQSKQGVDCSALVQITYAQHFGIQLPRSTDQQATRGIDIRTTQAMPGDLVFFKTGPGRNHVGLYLGERWFLHASSSQGVAVSRLDDPYWQRAFWKMTRVL